MPIGPDMLRPTFTEDELDRLASRIKPNSVIEDVVRDEGEVSSADSQSTGTQPE